MSLGIRSLLCLLALGAAALSVLGERSRVDAIAEVERSFAEVAPTAQVARQLEQVLGETDPIRASVAASRELIGGVVSKLPPESTAQRLLLVAAAERARSLARDALLQRPADADAAALLGAGTYLARTLDRDRRLFTESAAWEAPLELASELAPGAHRASEFLAIAYLDVWPSLSERKREIAVDLLREGFQEPETFRRLIGAWLRQAPDLDTALSVVPDDPFAWQTLTSELARERRLADLVVAEQLRREKLAADMDARLRQADRLLEAERIRQARLLLVGVLKEAEIDGLFAPRVEHVLSRLPPGPIDRELAGRLGEWLDWAFDLCLLERCPFSPGVIQRLDVLSGHESEARRAAAALAAGDLVEGERLFRLERTAAVRANRADWGLYRLFAARAYRERGDLNAARRELDALAPVWKDHPVAALEEGRLRQAEIPNGRRSSALSSSRAPRTPRELWVRNGRYSKVMIEAQKTGSLSLHLGPEEGPPTVLALAIDGQPPLFLEATPGEFVQPGMVLTPGPHLIETRRIAGGEARPVDVTIAP